MRHERLEHQLKKEISNIIHDEVKDPKVGFITIIRVELSADLKVLKVFYSILGKDSEVAKGMKALEKAKGFIRYSLAHKIKLRTVPELIFKLDRSSEYSIYIQEELNKLKSKEDKI
ncbi:MAG: 30S ribosome-binding factor RbfA [Candidatus Omnitrophota bacterium]